jgi:hypothetical protein
VSTGYGALINDIPNLTEAEKMRQSDYVFIRLAAPFSLDPDSGPLGYPLQSLEYASNDNAAVLDLIRTARTAIDQAPATQTQIIVGVDGGRVSVVQEILTIGVSGLYLDWMGTYPGGNLFSDKVFLDVAFGIVNGTGTLPVGLPLSDAAAAAQSEDLPNDGQHATFVEGFGISTPGFF